MSAVIPARIRDAVASDVSFVYDSWLRSYRKAQSEVRDEDYFSSQRRRIDRVLRGPGFLRVVHPEGAPSVIAAWACLDAAPAVLHYVYVKEEYRGHGFARALLTGRAVATHLTDGGKKLKSMLGMRYLPYLLDGIT